MDTPFHLTLVYLLSLSDFVHSCYLICPSLRWTEAFKLLSLEEPKKAYRDAFL